MCFFPLLPFWLLRVGWLVGFWLVFLLFCCVGIGGLFAQWEGKKKPMPANRRWEKCTVHYGRILRNLSSVWINTYHTNLKKERESELVQQKDKHSLLSLSNGQACSRPFPEAWADRNTAFQPNGPQAPAFVCWLSALFIDQPTNCMFLIVNPSLL